MNPATRVMIARLNELAAQGMTYAEAAAAIEAPYEYVARYANQYAIPLKKLNWGSGVKRTSDPRSEEMKALYGSGQTLIQIGGKYGITRERVRQIMTKYHGVRAKDGGRAISACQMKKAFAKKRDERCQRRFGCSYKDYREIVLFPGKPTYAFGQQKKNAQARCIPWELTLSQWWKTWQQSGHWRDRGRTLGKFGMCRLNDIGPYAVDNVYIATGTENIQDYYVNRRAADLAEAAA